MCRMTTNKISDTSLTTRWTSVDLGCTNIPGKEPHIQVDVSSVVTPGSIGGVMVSTLARNVRDVGLIPALGAIFHIFITPTREWYK